MKAAGDRVGRDGRRRGPPEAGAGVSWVVAEAYDADGAQLAEVQLSGPEPYALTAGIIAWAAQQRRRAATGALGPVEASGSRRSRRARRRPGLTRVAA